MPGVQERRAEPNDSHGAGLGSPKFKSLLDTRDVGSHVTDAEPSRPRCGELELHVHCESSDIREVNH